VETDDVAKAIDEEEWKMPIVSQQKIDDISQTLRNGTFQEKRDCLRETAFSPPDDLAALPMIGGVQAGLQQWNDPAHANFQKSKMSEVGEMVSYLRLCPSVKNMEKFGSVAFQSTFANRRTNQEIADGFDIPAWFLPWRQAGALVKLKITDVNNNGGQLAVNGANHANPGLFFTAAVSGCSVIVVGNPSNPSVYHGGSGNPITNELQGHEKTEAFWLRKSGRVGTALKPLGSIGKTDYISELIPGARTDADRLDKQTHLGNEIKKKLEQSGEVDELSLQPWGYVYGLRKADGTWFFELVKCVSLTYYKWRVKKRFLRRDKKLHVGEQRPTGTLANNPTTGAPSYKIAKIADDGPAQITYNPIGPGDYTEQKISDCKVIGHQEFFPGQGRVDIRNLSKTELLQRLVG
jgi:hypothetical protein